METRRIHNTAEVGDEDTGLHAITKNGEANDDKDPDDIVKEKDDKVPGDKVVNEMMTCHFIRTSAMKMIARSKEEVKLTKQMYIKRLKANNHHGELATIGRTR